MHFWKLYTALMSYVYIVEDIVLDLLHACRDGYWELHLHTLGTMIPWCFAYNTRSQAVAKIVDCTAVQ